MSGFFAKIELKGSVFLECKLSANNCPKHVGKSCPKNCFFRQSEVNHSQNLHFTPLLIHNSTNVHFPFWKNPILFLVCLPSSKKYMVPLCNGLKLILKEYFLFQHAPAFSRNIYSVPIQLNIHQTEL